MFTPFAFVKQASSVPPAPPLLLNDYPGAAGAWSVRQLDNTYTGYAIRVRRASDSTTQDIGFDANGDLDTSAITSFCTGTQGYVSIIYDQSGNGVDLSQATTNRQPKIYDGGIVTKGTNGRPSLQFNGSMNLVGSYGVNSDSYMSVFNVNAPSNTSTTYVSYGQSTTTTGTPAFGMISHDSGWFGNFMWGAGQEAQYSPNTTNLVVLTSFRKATSPQNVVFVNGVQGGVTTNVTDVTIGPVVSMGCVFPGSNSGAGTFAYDGYISEIIVYRTDESSNQTGIESNISAYF